MTFSQNLQFDGRVPAGEGLDHPAGAFIARLLQSKMQDSGWRVGEVGNWRGSGWSLVCRQGDAELQVAICEIAPSEWMLQVGPFYVPGLFGRLCGRGPSADCGEVLALARVIHFALAADSHFSRLRWRWDGLPDDRKPTPEPTPWDDAS